MAAKEDPIKKMEAVAKALVANAEKLVLASQEAASAEDLQPLQSEQDQLVNELLELDKMLQSKGAKPHSDHPSWIDIEALLETFEDLNQTFITNLKVRKELIQFELQDIKKAKKGLNSVKGSYGALVPSKDKKRKSQNKINTLS